MFKSMERVWRATSIVLFGIFSLLTLSEAAHADGIYTAPNRRITDVLGVDIGTNEYEREDQFLTIGDPASGGLSWRFLPHAYQDPYAGVITYVRYPAADSDTDAYMKVNLAGNATIFWGNCIASCTNETGDGATLVKIATNWVFTDHSGVVYKFDIYSSYTQVDGVHEAIGDIGNLQSIQYPNGHVVTINGHYNSNCGPPLCVYNVDSVVSDQGYGLKWSLNATTGVSTLYGVNMSAHTCDAQVNCDAYDSSITEQSTTVVSSLNGQTYNVTKITDAAGNISYYGVSAINGFQKPGNPLAYQRQDTIVFYKAPTGEEVILNRDTAGRVSTLVNNLGTWTYVYSDTIYLAQQPTGFRNVTLKDPNGNAVYTAKVERPDAIIDYYQDALSHQTTYSYSWTSVGTTSLGFYRVTQVAKPEGNSTSYTYDGRGNITQVTNTPKSGSGLSATTVYANYDGSCTNPVKCNKPNWTEDARGHYTYYTYDGTHGGVTLVQSPADASGVTPETVTNWAQYTAQVKNSSGALVNAGTIWLPQTSSTCASAATCNGTANQTVTTTAYATYNLLPSSVTTAAGDSSLSATTSVTYDTIGNKVAVDGPRTDVNDVSYATYDADRRPVYEIGVDPDGAGALPRVVTHHIYDASGRETQTETGTSPNTDGSSFTRASYATAHYNSLGQKDITAAYIDGNGTAQSLTQFGYDNRNRLVCTAVRMNSAIYGSLPSSACTLGATGSYGPDRITVNTYDNANQLTEVDQAYGVSGVQRAYARYSYNANGTKATEMDANGNKTAYIYDGFDRLSQIQYPSTSVGSGTANTADYEQFQYDAASNKTVWRRRNGKTFYYNYDNLNREILHYVSNGSVQNVYTGYDLEGHALYARYGSTSGSGITNSYDGLGRLYTTQDMNGRWVTYGHTLPIDALTQIFYPDGMAVDTANRDALGRLGTMYFYNGSGYLTVAQFAYSALGQIGTISKGAASAAFGYDNLGRLTSMGDSLVTSGYSTSWGFTYNPASQVAATTASTTAFDYKETANSTVGKTYDGLNRDATFTTIGGYDANGNLSNDGTRLFYYDAYNRLTGVGASAYPANGPYLTFVYDPLGRLSSQTYYGTTTSFLYDGTNLIGEYDGSGNLTERYVHGEGTDEPLVWFHGSGTSDERFFLQDYHGSVIGYTDASGNLQALYKYGPYGEPKNISNGTDFTGARFRYTGQTVIPEAQLYYYKARVYDPTMGHFLQTDPIGSKDDLDLYAYVADNPVNASDPTGTIACCGEGMEPPPEPIKPVEEPIKPADEVIRPAEEFSKPVEAAPVVIQPGNAAASTPAIGQVVENVINEFDHAVFGRNPDAGVPTVADVVTPGGNPIGVVVKGATPDIRTVDPKQFTTMQQTILSGANPDGTYAKGQGTWFVTANGERVGVRTSVKSGVTMDLPTLGMKIHQQ